LSEYNFILGSSSPFGCFLKSNLGGNYCAISRGNDSEGVCIDLKEIKSWGGLKKTFIPDDVSLITIYFNWYEESARELNFLDFLIGYLKKVVPKTNINVNFSSSLAVYGKLSMKTVDEKHPIMPITQYAKAKVAAENLLGNMLDIGAINGVSIARIPCLVGFNAKHNFLVKVKNTLNTGVGNISLSYIHEKFNAVTNFETVQNFFLTTKDMHNGSNNNAPIVANIASDPSINFYDYFQSHNIAVEEAENNWGNPPSIIDQSFAKSLGLKVLPTEYILDQYLWT